MLSLAITWRFPEVGAGCVSVSGTAWTSALKKGEGRKPRGSQVCTVPVSAVTHFTPGISSSQRDRGGYCELCSGNYQHSDRAVNCAKLLTSWHYHKIIFMQNPAASAVPAGCCTQGIWGFSVVYNHFPSNSCKFGPFFLWFELACRVWAETGSTWAELILDIFPARFCLCFQRRPRGSLPAQTPSPQRFLLFQNLSPLDKWDKARNCWTTIASSITKVPVQWLSCRAWPVAKFRLYPARLCCARFCCTQPCPSTQSHSLAVALERGPLTALMPVALGNMLGCHRVQKLQG